MEWVCTSAKQVLWATLEKQVSDQKMQTELVQPQMVELGCYSDALAVMFHTWERVLQGQIVVHSKKHRFGKG